MPVTSSQSMGMIGGASLRMSPSRSERHRSSLAADFMKQLRMRSDAQQRYQRNQVTLTRAMRTRMQQEEERRRRQTAAFQEKISRVRGRMYYNRGSGSSSTHRSNSGSRGKSNNERPSSASSRMRIQPGTDLKSRKVYVPANNTTVPQRRRPASAGLHRHQNQPQWQLVGARIGQQAILSSKMMRMQQQDEREAKRRQRPKSADPRGRRRIRQQESFGSRAAIHVNAPTIVTARMSPRSVRIAKRNRKTRRLQSARPTRGGGDRHKNTAAAEAVASSTTRKMIQHEVGRPVRSTDQAEVASSKPKPRMLVIPTAGMVLDEHKVRNEDAEGGTNFYDMDFTFGSGSSPRGGGSATESTISRGGGSSKTDGRDRRSDVRKITLSPKPPPHHATQSTTPTATTTSLHHNDPRRARSRQQKERKSIHSSLKRQLQCTKEIAAKMHSGFSQFEFSVLSSTMGKVGSSRSWHVNALQLLEFGKNSMGLKISLSDCQALLANCPIESWLRVFDHTAWITINEKGDARSARISDHEATMNGGGFFLDYNSFRERFWEPINKKLRAQLSQLKKAESSISAEGATNSDPDPAWEPRSLVSGYEGGKRDRRSQVELCEEQLKQCRRLRSLYISIRRGLKRRHTSCSVAFSSFKLATDPIVSCEALKKAARLCAPQVLSSCQLHIAEHEFVQAIAWLGQEWIKTCQYSGVLMSGSSSSNAAAATAGRVESRAFFQWLCLGRYSDAIGIPI